MNTEKHDLFWELEAFDPHWQKHYDTLRSAAVAASCLPEYYAYMATSEGMQHKIRFTDVPDTVAQNRAERRLRERMANLARRGGGQPPDLAEYDDGE